MPTPLANDNHHPPNGSAATPSASGSPPERGPGPEDLITEAEAIRAALQEAHAQLGRLLAALKHQRRQARAVQAAVASLRQLGHLGP